MGVHKVLILVFAFGSVTTALPVEEPAIQRSMPARVGSLDQSAESSEIHQVDAVAQPSEYDFGESFSSDDSESDEPVIATARGATDHAVELQGGHQTFFPSFANLFEPRPQPARLTLGNQEGAYSQRPNSYRSLLNYPLFGGYRNIDTFGKQQNAPAALVDTNAAILGSGNFGVIKGGTFLGQNDEGESEFSDGFSSFYNNGHGRPSINLGYNANPRPNYSQDQFANFRDFADINTPSNSAFSHFVVVYANKNDTIQEVSDKTKKIMAEPKNIIETLELLDHTEAPVSSSTKEPKMSKVKAKLAKNKLPEKKEYWKKSSSKTQSNKKEDLEEPLLALS